MSEMVGQNSKSHQLRNKTSNAGLVQASYRLAKKLTLGVVFGIGLVSQPVLAQVPVTDAKVTANTQQILTQVTEALKMLQSINKLTGQIQGATGTQGASSGNGLTSMLSGAGMGGGASSMLSSLSGLGQMMSSASGGSSGSSSTAPFTAALGALQNVMNGSVTGSNAIQQLQGALYTNSSSAAPTAQQVEAVNDLRRLNLQNAAISALSAALQVKNSVGSQASSQMSSLMSGAGGSQNLRGDLAANTATMMKVLEQAVAQNGLLAAGLHLSAATSIANDGVSGVASQGQNQQ